MVLHLEYVLIQRKQNGCVQMYILVYRTYHVILMGLL